MLCFHGRLADTAKENISALPTLDQHGPCVEDMVCDFVESELYTGFPGGRATPGCLSFVQSCPNEIALRSSTSGVNVCGSAVIQEGRLIETGLK